MNTRRIKLAFVVAPLLAACSASEGDTSTGEAAVLASTVAPAVDLVAAQRQLDTFLAEHEVLSNKTYCRVDIAAPECRNLITFKNKATQEPVTTFMTTFSAPFRQAGGAEYFVPDASGAFTRLGDKLVDGKVVVEDATPQPVEQKSGGVVIKELQFGPMVAELSFNETESVLLGVRPSATDPTQTETVRIVYKRFEAR